MKYVLSLCRRGVSEGTLQRNDGTAKKYLRKKKHLLVYLYHITDLHTMVLYLEYIHEANATTHSRAATNIIFYFNRPMPCRSLPPPPSLRPVTSCRRAPYTVRNCVKRRNEIVVGDDVSGDRG